MPISARGILATIAASAGQNEKNSKVGVIVYPPFFLQVRCSRDDLLLLFGLFGFISYLY
jgi:hypothetical protein